MYVAASKTVVGLLRTTPGALTTFASRQPIAIRRPFSSWIRTVSQPRLPISSLVFSRTYATEPEVGTSQAAQGQDIPENRRLYVGNLVFETTEEIIRKEFSEFGNVATVHMPQWQGAPNRNKGMAYVTFEKLEDAVAARKAMDRQVMEGRTITVQFARNSGQAIRRVRPDREPTRTLYIGNMAFDMTDQDLNELFAGLTGVLDVRVAIDRTTGRPRGFAHADFTAVEHAIAAKEKIEKAVFYNRRLKTDYAENQSENMQRLSEQQKAQAQAPDAEADADQEQAEEPDQRHSS